MASKRTREDAERFDHEEDSWDEYATEAYVDDHLSGLASRTPLISAHKPDSLFSPGGTLCERCGSIDMDAVFSHKRESHKHENQPRRPAMSLGKIDSWTEACVLCRYFFDIAARTWGIIRQLACEEFEEDAYSVSWQLYLYPYAKTLPPHEFDLRYRSRGLVLYPDFEPYGVWLPRVVKACERMIMPAISRQGLPPGGIHRALSQAIDYAHMRGWINSCQKGTNRSCTRHQQRSGTQGVARLIDCRTRQLVDATDQEYVALSYVWGDQSPPSKEEDRETRSSLSLPLTVPLAIQDAITIVQELGYQYLWVDRYCVDQYHSLEKENQLRAMADVYGQAVVTIIALCNDACEGIFGVSRPRRAEQVVLQTSTREYVSLLPTLKEAFQETKYSTRAWTYQELALSQRCLVFSSSQVYFHCQNAGQCETGPIYVPGRYSLQPESTKLNGIISFSTVYTWNYHQKTAYLGRQMNEYTTRSLKYESDTLNAFRGILVRSAMYSYYGHPLYAKEGEEQDRKQRGMFNFLRSLMWSHLAGNAVGTSKKSTQQKRELCVPSWSWASCRSYGPQWPDSLQGSMTIDPARYLTSVRVQNDQGLVDLSSVMLSSPSYILPETSPQLIFENALLIRQIEIRRGQSQNSANTCNATGYTISPFIRKIPLLAKGVDPITIWPDEVSVSFDNDVHTELVEIETKMAELTAILLVLASSGPAYVEADGTVTYGSERNYDYLDYYFLLVHRYSDPAPAKRIGVMRAKLTPSGALVNPAVYTRGVLIVG